MECKWCSSKCRKAGKQANGIQKYQCKKCLLYQQAHYTYKACNAETHDLFRRFRIIGCGARGIARFLRISVNTVQKWIAKALVLSSVEQFRENEEYDIDEIQMGWKTLE